MYIRGSEGRLKNIMRIARFNRFFILLLAGACGGCDALGALIYKTAGPTSVDAQFVLPKEPTLVLVENRRNPAEGEYDADEIARNIGDELKKHDVAPLVDADKLTRVRDANPDQFGAMAITALGRAVDAKQVVYVNLIESGIESDASDSSLHGKATARVRVVEVKTGQTLWPLDSNTGGIELSVEIPYSSRTDPVTVSAMHNAMVSQLSGSIAKLFYTWHPEDNHEAGAAE
jgi:hypothetical protein